MACCNLQTFFFCLQEKSGPSYASLPAAVVQPEEPALESELDKRGACKLFEFSIFKSLVGAAQEVQQEAEEAQEGRYSRVIDETNLAAVYKKNKQRSLVGCS